jgi:NitT/TauT family transport system substrate-binding protein
MSRDRDGSPAGRTAPSLSSEGVESLPHSLPAPFRWPVAAFGLLICCLTAGCSREQPVPLRMGSSVWPGFEAFYVARERGYWRDDEVRLVVYASTSELMRAFRNGTIDAGLLTLDEALLLAQDVPDIRIILITDVSNGADVIMAAPRYASMKDLKGHRVGTETTALGAYVLLRALQLSGLTREDVVIVPLEFSEHEAAFQRGSVDAVVTYEPVRTKLRNAGARQVFDSTQMPGEIVDVLAVRGGFVARNPQPTRAVLQGFYRAQRYFQERPDDALRIAAARENVTPDEFRQSIGLLRVPDATEAKFMLTGRTSSLQAGAKSLAALMVAQNLLSKPVDLDSLFDKDTLQRVLQ